MTKESSPLFLRRAKQLVTLKGTSEAPVTKAAMKELHIIENGSVWMEAGKIAMVGEDEAVAKAYAERINEAKVIDATGKLVTPGLVDPHTHLVFAGSREQEFNMRLNGATYMEIMHAGGGIHSTTRATRAASREQLYAESYERLQTFLLHGVTTLEAKSGYGLDMENEIKQLEVAKQLNKDHPVDIVATFMGAHAIPMAYQDHPDVFVDKVIEMMPRVAELGLAEFNDVFCEKGVFTPEQAERILEAGKQYNLLPKIHADEIEPYQGAEVAAKVGAVSADHLLKASEEGVRRLAEKKVVGVLLPGTAFFLMSEFANARKMIDAGVPIALSTDRNPGSSPTESLQLMMQLGCLHMKMTPAEVLVAATINAAHAIHRGKEIGSIEVGKKGDVVIWNAPDYSYIQYHYGVNLAEKVMKAGKLVVDAGRIV
ncbi:imidazolonepropionase [Evansella caseinilytica]|uniref:Imidazolonepropionase n=1 Tax=Evansella caseinilytica TaxID=1503961 RepID=A0A1H3SCV6_9BACI|nr:imidazolonepropionase [Evansella caseinilytica]SDZ35381.1 imidazolonepropionase [Evansella caseinilytica]